MNNQRRAAPSGARPGEHPLRSRPGLRMKPSPCRHVVPKGASLR